MKKICIYILLTITLANALRGQTQQGNRGTIAVIIENPNNIAEEFVMEILSNGLMNAFRNRGYSPVIRDVSILAQLDSIRVRSASGIIRQEDAIGTGLLLGEEWICHVRILPTNDPNTQMISVRQVMVRDGSVSLSIDDFRPLITFSQADSATNAIANRVRRSPHRQQANRGTIAIAIENSNSIVEEFVMEALSNQLMNTFRDAGYNPIIRDASILAQLDAARERSASGAIREEDAIGTGLLLGEEWIAHVRILPTDGQNRMISVRQVMVRDGSVPRTGHVSNPLITFDDARESARGIANRLIPPPPPSEGELQRMREQQQRAREQLRRVSREQRFRDSGRANYISLLNVQIGYPFRLVALTSITGRHGGIVGVGYYAHLGMQTSSLFPNDAVLGMYYSVGAKFFPYKNIFLSAGFGTVGFERMETFNREDGRFGTSGWRQGTGISLMAGHNFLFGEFNMFILSVGAGMSYDLFTGRWKPTFNLIFGIALDL